MIQDKDKKRNDSHHVETDAFRATFIDNIEKAKELGDEFEAGKYQRRRSRRVLL